ncbi:MAG: S49 family peptidase, partial [Pirellulaceae bacterium]
MSQDSPQPGSPVDAEIITAPTMNAPVPQPMQIIIKQQGLLSRFWSWIGWTGFLLCLMALLSMTFKTQDYFNTTGGIQEKYHSGDKRADAKIAIIRVTGSIGRGDGYVKHQIDRVRADENVKGIVLRVDSPGGTVTGSDFIYHHLTRLREERQLPIVVSMGGMAASGGYYVSMAVGDQEKSI